MTRADRLRASAPECARFEGYGGGNALVFTWHQMEIRFPARRLSDAALEQFSVDTGAVAMNDWDRDDLEELAAMMGFHCDNAFDLEDV